jgi:hypothetical protein
MVLQVCSLPGGVHGTHNITLSFDDDDERENVTVLTAFSYYQGSTPPNTCNPLISLVVPTFIHSIDTLITVIGAGFTSCTRLRFSQHIHTRIVLSN